MRDSLFALPTSFRSETIISGVRATDIFTLNDALAATIEDQVVHTLNDMRTAWDPEGAYKAFRFVRQSQTFPDVLLKRRTPAGADEILFGIELKGWYLLAKEGVPSLRFLTDPDACAAADLIMVVPWTLSSVLSGRPIVFEPWAESARYAAEFRDYFWSEVRQTKQSREIHRPPNPMPYPKKADQVADSAVADQGSNYGRLARTGIMDPYLSEARGFEVCGVAAEVWTNFFKSVERAPSMPPLVVQTGALQSGDNSD